MNDVKDRCSRILLLAHLLLMSACTQAAFTAANLPTHLVEMAVEHDRAYGSELLQKLDVYIPANTMEKQLDVLVFFYGGRWTYGAKEDYRFIAATFVKEGFIVVIPDYRKYPQVRFPVFVEDGARALAWVSDHIVEWHGNPARIHVVGHSAGAHIGALLAADPHYLADVGKDRSLTVHDFAGLAGPYAFTPDEPDLEDIFGPPQNYPNMQVTTFIDGTQPPMLLLYGNKDTAVKLANLERLEQRIKQRGGCVRSRIYPNADHTDLIEALSWWNRQRVPVVEDITTFFGACRAAGVE
ncbi:MAG: alpha/beta hydrolase [Nitrospira sp.]|nr:MAG: alpha/beta hydrolase [Nitrospira sp.]